MKCPSCGKESGADAKRCEQCGTFLGPTLKHERPSEDEVPNNMVAAIGAAVVPLLCALGGGFALLALPVALYAVWQAKTVDELLKKRDAAGAQIASINAKKYALVAVVLAVLLGIGHFGYKATKVKDVVKRDIPTAEAE